MNEQNKTTFSERFNSNPEETKTTKQDTKLLKKRARVSEHVEMIVQSANRTLPFVPNASP